MWSGMGCSIRRRSQAFPGYGVRDARLSSCEAEMRRQCTVCGMRVPLPKMAVFGSPGVASGSGDRTGFGHQSSL